MLDDKLVIEHAGLIFRNFSGNPSTFNPEGKKEFSVLLDPDRATELKALGWNVKYAKQRESDENPPQAFMSVAVSYENYPPTVILVTSKNKTVMSEEDIKMLDWAELENVDLIIRPYSWDVNGNKGVKAYLKSMYVKVAEDAFSEKYADIPDGSAAVPEKSAVPPSDYDGDV